MTSLLLIEPQPASDQQWYERMESIAQLTPEIYAYLGPAQQRNDEAYRIFLDSGCYSKPNLLPERQHQTAVKAEKRSLQTLLKDLLRFEKSNLVSQAYSLRIAELITNADLYLAAVANDAPAYAALNKQLYGSPNRHVFAAVCQTFRNWAGQPIFEPTAEIFAVQRQLHFGIDGFYTRLFAGDLPTGSVDRQRGDAIIKNILDGLEASQYRLADAADDYWGIRHSQPTIVRPAEYCMSAEAFIAVVGHEIGSHLLERLNGLRQPLRLLALGLAGYEKANEGRALLREQVTYSDWQTFARQPRWYEIMRRHFAISLAVGHGGRPLGFAEVFAAIQGADSLWYLQQGIEPGEMDQAALNLQAWQLVSRVLMGTDGGSGAYYKDIVYLEGNLACWQLASSAPAVIPMGDLGKFDITNHVQRQLLG